MKNYLFQLVTDHEWSFPQFKIHSENSRNTLNKYEFNDKSDFLRNKVAIVTGASSGIGKAIAWELAEKGANVILASRNKEKLNNLMSEINNAGGLAIALPTDVSDEAQCKLLIKRALKAFGKIDILVNNAGISMRANFDEVELDVLKKVMDTNFWGSVYCSKFAFPYISKQHGSIVGISSICGITPLPGRTGYSASKHALDGFLESLRVENSDNDLHVMLVHPGFTTSNIRNVALNKNGVPQVESPLDEEKLMSAEQVATEVIEGIIHRKRDITLTVEGKLITWIYRRLPYMAERLIHHEMQKEAGSPF